MFPLVDEQGGYRKGSMSASAFAVVAVLLSIHGVATSTDAAAVSVSSCSDSRRSVVEHTVLFSMPVVARDKKLEDAILSALYGLRTVPGVFALSTGRLLKEEKGFTHAIFVRLSSTKSLVDYYNSTELEDVVVVMEDSIDEERTVDYQVSVGDNPDSLFLGGKDYKHELVHMSMFRIRTGTSDEVVEELIDSLTNLAQEMSSIVLQITAGAHNYIRDGVFSHGFVAHLASGELVEAFYSHPAYLKVLHMKLQPICENIVSVDYVPYVPEAAASLL